MRGGLPRATASLRASQHHIKAAATRQVLQQAFQGRHQDGLLRSPSRDVQTCRKEWYVLLSQRYFTTVVTLTFTISVFACVLDGIASNVDLRLAAHMDVGYLQEMHRS